MARLASGALGWARDVRRGNAMRAAPIGAAAIVGSHLCPASLDGDDEFVGTDTVSEVFNTCYETLAGATPGGSLWLPGQQARVRTVVLPHMPACISPMPDLLTSCGPVLQMRQERFAVVHTLRTVAAHPHLGAARRAASCCSTGSPDALRTGTSPYRPGRRARWCSGDWPRPGRSWCQRRCVSTRSPRGRIPGCGGSSAYRRRCRWCTRRAGSTGRERRWTTCEWPHGCGRSVPLGPVECGPAGDGVRGEVEVAGVAGEV